jgi:hypothetical protein
LKQNRQNGDKLPEKLAVGENLAIKQEKGG